MDTSKKFFWNILSLFLLVLVIFVLGFVMPAALKWGNSFTPARTLTVSAQGMTTATPDMAEISFSVVSQGKNPSSLSDDNNTKMSAVMQFVSSQGIASSDIATTGYDLEPDYQYNQTNQTNSIDGYTLTQTVQIKIRDLTKVASVLGGLAPLGVNQIGSVDFTFQNPDEFVSIARGDALTKAATEAGEMAAQAGASLGEVITVNESSVIPTPQPYMSAGISAMAATAPSTVSVAPGTQDVTDNVTVTYAIQ
jgi:uncharacterized protein YggE